VWTVNYRPSSLNIHFLHYYSLLYFKLIPLQFTHTSYIIHMTPQNISYLLNFHYDFFIVIILVIKTHSILHAPFTSMIAINFNPRTQIIENTWLEIHNLSKSWTTLSLSTFPLDLFINKRYIYKGLALKLQKRLE
jgi:hypothetical protein